MLAATLYIVWWTNKSENWEVMFRASNDGGQTFVDKINLSNSSDNRPLALLMDLSYNNRKQSQNNTVVVQQKEMDRVGVEPTTSASAL